MTKRIATFAVSRIDGGRGDDEQVLVLDFSTHEGAAAVRFVIEMGELRYDIVAAPDGSLFFSEGPVGCGQIKPWRKKAPKPVTERHYVRVARPDDTTIGRAQ